MKKIAIWLNERMKKVASWLGEHAVVLGGGGKDSVVHLWCILISFVLLTVFCICGINGKALEWLCAVLFLGGSIVPPIVAGIIALVKKAAWNPWYWFPIAIGNAIGGMLSMLICWIFGFAKF